MASTSLVTAALLSVTATSQTSMQQPVQAMARVGFVFATGHMMLKLTGTTGTECCDNACTVVLPLSNAACL